MTALRTLFLTVVLTAGVAQAPLAQDFPSRPLSLVVPYSAGGSADMIARTLADAMSENLGQPVVVENRPGAATAIGAAYVANAPADGQTMLFAGSPTFVVAPALNPDVGYDGMAGFEFVSMVANVPTILVVSKGSGISSLDELVARATATPEAISDASFGNGTLPHLTALMFSGEIEAEMMHIPYPGVAPAAVDILAGNVDTGFMNGPAVLGYVESGDMVPLAITSTQRSSRFPEVKTMDELGYAPYEMGSWLGIAVPAGTPDAVIARIDEAIGAAMALPAVANRLEEQSVGLFYKTSTEFDDFVKADAETVYGIMDATGLGAEI